MEDVDLKKLGIASETIYLALEGPMNKNLMALVSKLVVADPNLPTLLDIRSQIKSQLTLMRELGVKIHYSE